jgi:uncharacterized protein
VSIKVYSDTSIEKCLQKATKELNIPVDKMKYDIIDEQKGIFKKKASISVTIDNNDEQKHGTVKIVDGNIIIKNAKEKGKPAVVKCGTGVNLIVDGNKVNSCVEVYEESKIELTIDKNEAERILKIDVSPNKMQVYITIKYLSQNVCGLQECEESNSITLNTEIKEKKFPPKFSVNEIKDELRKNKVFYGIIEEALLKCSSEQKVDHVLIVQGLNSIDDIDDILDIKYKKSTKELIEDSKGNVDFKTIGYIAKVKKGDLIAVLKKGQEGKDGIDVYGKTIKHKIGKKISLNAGEGCELINDTEIVSSIDGKPYVKNTSFTVKQVHEINGNVDLETGNIKFNGDVIIYGAVKEGMKVEADRSIEIYKNIAQSEIIAKGDVYLRANIIQAKIYAGRDDVFKSQYMKNLEKLNELINVLSNTGIQVKKHNLLGRKAKDGEIAKILIENKFKGIVELSKQVMIQSLKKQREENKLAYIINKYLIGLGPLKISSFDDFNELIELINNEIENLSGKLTVPVDVYTYYSQDSIIESSGSIYITGKGEYVSNLIANDSIHFTGIKSIARGGVIKAKNEIRCNIVGSEGGVSTKLIVEKDGHIWANIVYQNTMLFVGMQEHTVEKASKDLHAYLDKSGELIVEKFVV